MKKYWVRVITYGPDGLTRKIERWPVQDKETAESQVEFIGSNHFQSAIVETHEELS